MSTDYHPPEEPTDSVSPVEKSQGRGYFFYIAVFFILIAVLCYLLNSPGVNWSQGVPAVPAAPTSTSK